MVKPAQKAPSLHLKCKAFILFKADFLHLKGLANTGEPPDSSGNELTLDIQIGGSGQDIKYKITNTSHLQGTY